MMRKFLVALMSCVVLLGTVPAAGFAETDSTGLCDHHNLHTAECGYSETSQCTFVCAVCNVQELIESLPGLEKVRAMSESEKADVYKKLQSIQAAYKALTADEQAQLGNQDSLKELSDYFKSKAEPQETKKSKASKASSTAVQGFDQTIIVEDGGNIQTALDSLTGTQNGDVLLRIDKNIGRINSAIYSVPTNKGITSLTIGTLENNSVSIGDANDFFSLFANGIPLIIDKGVEFKTQGSIFGGSNKNMKGDTSITVNPGASVGKIYGGGENSDVTGDVTIAVYGTVSSIYGGGYAYALGSEKGKTVSANVKGNVNISVNGADSSVKNNNTGGIHGGGSVYSTTTSDLAESLQADVTGNVKISVNCPKMNSAPIYGGGCTWLVQNSSLQYKRNLRADVIGDISIKIGGDMQFTSNNRSSVHGGGEVWSTFEVNETSSTIPTISAQVKGNIDIDASEDKHATSKHDDWDLSMFSSLYGGGFAKGLYTDASVTGSTSIVTARKAILDNAGLFGGGEAAVGGKACVSQNTYVEICKAAEQEASHDNAKNVYGGGNGGYYADATIGGNTTVLVNGNINFEPGSNSQVHGGGWATSDAGTAEVKGTAKTIIKGANVSKGICAGGRGNGQCKTKAAIIQMIGECSLEPLRSIDKGTVTDGLTFLIGDGKTETEVKTSYLYNPDSGNNKIVKVQVMDKAALIQNANKNKLFWYTTDLEVAQGGRISINNTNEDPKDLQENIAGTLSGEGTIAMPSNAQIVVNGGFSGNIALQFTGTPAAGTTVAWSPLGQSGIFSYKGEGLSLARTNTGSWYRWDLSADKKITVNVSNPEGGTVSPESQTVAAGKAASFTITCNPGYKVGSIVVDGQDKIADLKGSNYTLTNVQKSDTISVTFVKKTVADIEADISKLPEIDKSKPPAAEDVKTILDAKLDYEALPPTEKEPLDSGYRKQLNTALSALPEVNIVVSGEASVDEPNLLLENMNSSEAEKLKSGAYKDYRLLVDVSKTEQGSKEEEESITGSVAGASKAMQYDVKIKKIITTTAQPDSPAEVTLSKLEQPIEMVFPIPEEFQNVPSDVNRTFTMLRTHLDNGTYTTAVLQDLDKNPKTYTVLSNQFSLYTLLYKDSVVSPNVSHKITASAGEGGTISPSGVVEVKDSSDKVFTIKPDTGYKIEDVLVDGSSVGKLETYSFTTVVADHTISATFVKDKAGAVVSTDKASAETSSGKTAKASPSVKTAADSPSTGDNNNSNLLFWFLLAIVAGSIATGLGFHKRKKHD